MKIFATISLLFLGAILYAQNMLHLDPGDRIEHMREKFEAGDVNNDNVPDTVTAIYDRIVKADSKVWNDCGQAVCKLGLEFNKPIKPLEFEAMAVYVHPVTDVNRDGANEIAIYKWWHECCWVTLDLYTYKGGKWEILASSKAFISWDGDDFKNRIVKNGNNYYLIGDKWDEEGADIVMDRVRIK